VFTHDGQFAATVVDDVDGRDGSNALQVLLAATNALDVRSKLGGVLAPGVVVGTLTP
jgi:hypothetical protein